jgi:hypothetical protein
MITHSGITISLCRDKEPIYLVGKGWIHIAHLMNYCSLKELQNLVGLILDGDPILEIELIGIDCRGDISISLLFQNKQW